MRFAREIKHIVSLSLLRSPFFFWRKRLFKARGSHWYLRHVVVSGCALGHPFMLILPPPRSVYISGKQNSLSKSEEIIFSPLKRLVKHVSICFFHIISCDGFVKKSPSLPTFLATTRSAARASTKSPRLVRMERM